MKTIYVSLSILSMCVLVGCQSISDQSSEDIPTTYTQDSRKTIIPATCKSFFDGCNTCNKMDGSNDAVACTKMFCENYQEPKCLDTMHPSWDANNDGINDCEDDGSCDDSVDYTLPR